MHSGYGASEIQQFMVDGSVHGSLFSISSTTPPNPSTASHNVTDTVSGGQEVHHSASAATNSLKFINPFHHHHQHAHKPPPPLETMEFPHFHSIPITQQLFTRLPHPRHHQHQFQLFHNNPANYDQHRRLHSTPLFLNHDPDTENLPAATGAMPSFLAPNMNFKLAVDDSSGSGSKDGGLNNDDNDNITGGVLHGDDASESRFRLWQREEEDCAIKEPFWRPLDLDYINRNNKRMFKDKEPDNHRFAKLSRESDGNFENNSHPPASGSNYKLFSELEAIYRQRNIITSTSAGGGIYKNTMTTTNAANQTTGSGSALTGDEHPVMPTTAAGDNNSTGCEARQKIKKIHRQHSRRLRHRKKVQKESIAAFFEKLVKQLVDHQELLHQKFIEIIEKRDCERVAREEAWREREAARAAREAAARSRDRALTAAREAAIVSFLETITGETLNLPTHPQQISIIIPSAAAAITVDTLRDNGEEGGIAATMGKTSRWPKAEVQALIAVRSRLEGRFQEPGLKGPLWEEVSSSMAAIGYDRSAKRCKEKWENINKYFRKAKHSGRKRSQHSKTCPYFQQLDNLYSNPLPPSHLPPPPDGPSKNSELLDAVVVSGADHQGFTDGEEVGESEGRDDECVQ